MIIKYKNYELRTSPNVKERFDVIRIRPLIMNSGEKMKKKHGDKPVGSVVGNKEDELGLDMRLEYALDLLIKHELGERSDTVSLRDYLAEYKKSKDEVLTMLK